MRSTETGGAVVFIPVTNGIKLDKRRPAQALAGDGLR
jgi:hypothetical protein